MLYNSVGRLIWSERKRAKISEEELCKGICSRSLLHRLEIGERRCEKIMSDALLQRVGISADKFIYIMNPDEQDWLFLQEDLVDAVDRGNRKLTQPLLKKYYKMCARKCKLHKQFAYLCEVVLDWKNGLYTKGMLGKLEEAWEITMEDITMQEMSSCCLSLMECIIRMMYCRILEDMGEKEQAKEGYLQLLEYLEFKVDEEDRVKLYSQIAYRLMSYYLEVQDFQSAVELADKAVKLLKIRGRLFYMRKFLQVLLDYGSRSEDECRIYMVACDAIRWLYETYGVEEEEWVWNTHFGMAEVEFCGGLIRARRVAMGLTQEKLAEGICDAVTISRIECGKGAPKTQVLQKIMERIGMKEGGYEAINQIEQPEFFELANQISILLSFSKGEEAESLVEELDRRTKNKDKFVEQYIENVKAMALFIQKKMTPQEHFSRQWQALHLTMPYLGKKQQKEWRFSRQEVGIATSLSYSCEDMGKEEEILELLYDIKNHYEKKPFQLVHYIAGYEVVTRNIGNLLGNKGEYAEAIEIADKGIAMTLKAGRGLVMSLLLYDCGWDMEQLWETGKYTKKESLYYVKASVALNLLFYGESKSQFFVDHLKKYYFTT